MPSGATSPDLKISVMTEGGSGTSVPRICPVEVDDIDAVYQKARSTPTTILSTSSSLTNPGASGGFYIRDPAGNVVNVLWRTSDHRQVGYPMARQSSWLVSATAPIGIKWEGWPAPLPGRATRRIRAQARNRLVSRPPPKSSERAVGANDTVARSDDRKRIGAIGGADRAGCRRADQWPMQARHMTSVSPIWNVHERSARPLF